VVGMGHSLTHMFGSWLNTYGYAKKLKVLVVVAPTSFFHFNP
jgi:hypothetical protein